MYGTEPGLDYAIDWAKACRRKRDIRKLVQRRDDDAIDARFVSGIPSRNCCTYETNAETRLTIS